MSRGNNTEELQLLCNALASQGESENNGVKFIYMDDSTVYRFENNRMKKVSAAMIKKANKLLATQSSYPNQQQQQQQAEPQPQQPPKSKRKRQQQPQAAEEEEEDDEPVVVKPKRKQRTPAASAASASTIDLNEYWQVKNKNEYMNQELTRLNNKINKLKQYKQIVNKLTGSEYDPYEQQQPMQQQQQPIQQQPMQPMRNDSLFMF